MREMLFRGKRVDDGEWVEGNLINWNPKLNPRIIWFQLIGDQNEPEEIETNFEVHPETIGQFTNRTDHNTGKKIFQGDLVYVDDSGVGGLPSEMVGGTYKVVWEEVSASFMLEQLDGMNVIPFDEVCTYMVTGNIHDSSYHTPTH